MHSASDMALVVVHKGPTVYYHWQGPHWMTCGAIGYLLSQLTWVDDAHPTSGCGGIETGCTLGFTLAHHWPGETSLPTIVDAGVQVGATCTDLAQCLGQGLGLAVFFVSAHHATAGTVASTRQGTSGAAG